ncbi:MAG: DUF1566 domain-containing protein [Rubrivivax sp.]|nr:DUF1566 domain-containing protein [Rubrivivax sp.]
MTTTTTTLCGIGAWMLALAGSGAQAALEGRDVDGRPVAGSDPSAVFLYDAVKDLTWARLAQVDAPLSWLDAQAWVGGLVIGRFADWRLPATMQPDPGCNMQSDFGAFGIVGTGANCTGSEMGHLWHVSLGNEYLGLHSYGDFQNLAPNSGYWTATPAAWDPDGTAYAFFTGDVGQTFGSQLSELSVLAVRDGDVLAIPEPQAAAMLLAGLAVLALRRRGRRVA